ncbi:Transcriptional regulatory protein DevR (DosR) [Pigmentiphaga humi]|uniref:Transcriptional regulatory protein DevR (DosR) n=1 Tax=Pigmentiphaga humi TaxID=2478468 RepID=A0A3P4AZS6_9BURK|nr:PAS domain S-box protein [Pigmentiphaga humi]VCU68345.1 Transcriptional regulatory protein DevR (DosR) [Pigmentiphaga humi]
MRNTPAQASPKPQADRRQLQQIISGLSEGVMLIDPDGSIVWANKTALTIHEAATPARLGRTAREYVAAYTLKYRNRHALAPAQYPIMRLLGGECFSDVVVEVSKPGDDSLRRVHQVRGLALTTPKGEPESLVLVIQDVTERYDAEERFERTFNTNPAPAVICRLADLRYIKVNAGFLEMTGYARAQIIGHFTYELDVLNGAADRDLAVGHLKEGRPIPQMEAMLRLPQGRTRRVIVAGQPIEVGDAPCMLFTFMDMEPRWQAEEALRQSEERFSKAFRLAPVPMALCALDDLAPMDANEAFTQATGHEVRKNGAAAGHEAPWCGEDNRRRLLAALREGGVRDAEIMLRTRDGHEFDCLLSAETMEIQGACCVLVAMQDITERKQSEEELMAAIDAVMQDASWFSGTVIEKLAQLRRPSGSKAGAGELSDLTEREREVLGLMCQGENNEHIAHVLQLSPNTVRNHIATLYSKIGVHRRSDAIVWARQRGVTGYAESARGRRRTSRR